MYDVVIIGSGLGGLLCGYVLSKEGYSVCIVEKNMKIGGCLQTFKREDAIFDTGIHYIGSMDKDQVLYRYFKYFGLTEKLNLKKMDEDGFEVIHLESDNKSYNYAMEWDRFVDTILKEFPQEKNALNNYVKKIKEINDSLNLINLREVESYNIIESEYLELNAYNFVKSITSDNKLQQVLAGNNSIYAGNREKTPLYVLALIQNFFVQSSWRLVGGSGQIADFLSEYIVNNGGVILKNYEAVNFSVQNDRLQYLDFSNGERIEAKIFISDIHPANTLKMINSDLIKKVYRNRINSLENTTSTFSIYAVLKKDSFPYLNKNYYYHRYDDVWSVENYNEHDWPKGFMFLTPANSNTNHFADSMIAMTYMNFSDVQKWSDTSIEKRGGEYLEFKKTKAEILLDEIEKLFPGIRKHIKTYYTSTPLTYRDYTGTIGGSMYGIEKDCNNPLQTYIPPRTKIPNLFFTGQNINLHGALGVTIGSILTCAEFLGLNYLIKSINNAS